MKFAFCLFKYFSYGGLQRGFFHLAKECINRGHQVDIYTISWSESMPEDMNVITISPKRLTNHGRYYSFANKVQKYLKTNHYDAVVGFNKMPGLDVYFASDVCYASLVENRNSFYRLTPRCRTLLALEKAIFNPQSSTQIISISDQETHRYMSYYGTPYHRFHPVPPGISLKSLDLANTPGTREILRKEYGISPETNLVLMVGSNYRLKGVDRAILAISALPQYLKDRTLLMIIGKGKKKRYIQLAKQFQVSSNVIFLGKRNDVPRFLAGSDLLLHPAYHENTGTVLLEGIASGLPVLATKTCGYAFHIEQAQAGKVVPSPFRQEALNTTLMEMLISEKRFFWSDNGIRYAKNNDLYGRHSKSADIIEKIARKKNFYYLKKIFN